MDLRFEKRIFRFKSLILVLFFLLVCAILGGMYGQRYGAGLMGMVFAVIVGVLLVLEYLQLFPDIFLHLFAKVLILEPKGDLPENFRVYSIESEAPWSVSFSTLSKHIILISSAAKLQNELFETMLDYELVRVKRGMSLFHTLFLWCIALPVMLSDGLFFVVLRKTGIRFVASGIGNVMRLISYPFLWILFRFLYPVSLIEQNDHLVSLNYQSSVPLKDLFQFLYAFPSQYDFFYFAMIPFALTGPNSFGSIQKLWKGYVPELAERKQMMENVIS